MNAPAKLIEQPTNVVQADAGSLMAVISRAASDPNTDVDKLERLLGMYERITAREAAAGHDDAMNAAQEEMRPIAADAANPQTKSRYASYAALDRALRPIYTKHGFSLAFDTDDCPKDDYVRVVCRVKRAGHTETHHLDMPADGKGAKGGDVMTKTHATGAAVSYGKRYLLGMVFNIAVGEDNDGNRPERPPAKQAEARPPTVAERADRLEATLKGVKPDEVERAWELASALLALLSVQMPDRLAELTTLYERRRPQKEAAQ